MLSLTRRRVCRLQLLLVLASAVNILLSQIRDFPFCRLLRLAELRLKYSTPPPQGIFGQSQSQSQSQSYFTAGGLPPINLSWRQAP
jgi:hypothetical protein